MLFSLKEYIPSNYIIISLRAPISLGFGSYAWYSINFENNVDNWVSFNEDTKLLNVKPLGENIGNNFLVITATDNQGLEASATIPITVRYKNNSPNLNYKDCLLYTSDAADE